MFIVILLICIVIFIFFQRKLKKASLKFEQERQNFVDYLDSKNDLETLKKIGEINMFGVRERWYPKYTNLIPYLEEQIEETNDEKFISFLTAYKIFIKMFLLTMPFVVLSIIIPLYYIVSFFQNK